MYRLSALKLTNVLRFRIDYDEAHETLACGP